MTGEAEELAREAPEQYGLFYVDLSRTEFAPGAANLLPEETARRERAVPIERRGDVTVLAVSSPADESTLETLRTTTGGEIVVVIAPASQVLGAINRLYGDAAGRARRRGDEEEGVPGALTLEDSLREVLAPPEPSDFLPPPSPAAGADPSAEADAVGAAGTAGAAGPAAAAAAADAVGAGAAGTAESRPGTSPEEADLPSRNGHRAATAPSRTAGPAAAHAAPDDQGDGDDDKTAPGSTGRARAKSGTADADPDPVTAPAPVPLPAPEALATNGSHAATSGPRPVTVTPAEPDAGAADDPPSSNGVLIAPPEPAHDGAAATAPAAGAGTLDAVPTSSQSTPDRAVRVDAGSHADASSPGSATAPPGGASPPLPPPGKGSPGGEAGDAQSAQWPALARVLVASGRVSFDDMVRALRDHRSLGESLARYLQREKLVTEEDLVRAMAQEMGLEFVDLTVVPVDPTIAALVPDAVARRHMVLPIGVEDGVPVVAMANPTDVFAMDDLRTIMGRSFTPVVALRSQIDTHLRKMSESDSDVAEAAQHAEGTFRTETSGFEIENLHSVVEDAPIVRYVNLLILQALNERASDIHIEPTPRRMRIRFRIDGVMHDASSASPAIHAAVISRLKVLGEMDITEHRVPQEGRVSVSVGDRQIDLRLAMLPSLYGETCVMRLLDKTASIRQLSELGFLTDTLERYAHSYGQPYGVILVTGPTGAGKTTTLYGTLQQVMNKEKSVVTVEDPVEYQIEGITQVQINTKVGLQFSTALRSILRADPDIILVGEIRDLETATIAMEAALSGHLVLTTLHTNTAASTPLRLTEMGIEPFLVTSAVTGVLTQRLARVLCEKCKTPYEATVADFHAAGFKDADLEGLDTSTLWNANGCRTCSHTGYYGRMILCEVMPMTEEIERMIIEQQSIVAMERKAVEQGMRTLRLDGLIKALAGFTTLEEVLRVVI